MAVSTEHEMYGLLNRWASRMNVPIFLFNQATGSGTGAPVSTPGARVYTQPERENIAEGIKAALSLATHKLRFFPRPAFVTETIPLPDEGYLDRRGVLTRWAHVQAIGVRDLQVLTDGAAPVYSDTDGDGVDDLATVTVPGVPADLDVTTVRLFFSPIDTGAATGDPRWEIEPIRATLSGTTLTVRAHRALLVKPSIWAQPYSGDNYNKSAVNAADTGNATHFVDAVDVCTVTPRATGAVTLLANPYPDAGDTSPTSWEEFAAEAAIEDGRLGIVNVRPAPGVTLSARPTMLRLSYYAGYPLDDFGRMDAALATALLRLANCNMPVRPGLDSASAELWLSDIERDGTEHGGKLGVRAGEVAAWRLIKALRIAPSPLAIFGR
jgi:hypothetical protein